MSGDNINLPASILAKLRNLSRERGIPAIQLQEFFVIERFLYRLSVSKYQDMFVLKGALRFLVWSEPFSRPTRDIDLHGTKVLNLLELVKIFSEICQVEVSDDGFEFDHKFASIISFYEVFVE